MNDTSRLSLFFRYRAPEVLLQSSAYTPAIGDLLLPFSWVLLTSHLLDSVQLAQSPMLLCIMHEKDSSYATKTSQKKIYHTLATFQFVMSHSISHLFDSIQTEHNSTSPRANNMMLFFSIFLFSVIQLPLLTICQLRTFTDMWAVGAILAELFTLSPLFPGER